MARKEEKPVVESLAVLAPAERVWAALTGPRDLGLITLGRVELKPEPGAAFSWQWGVWEKVAPGAKPGRFTWRGTVLDVVPGSTLVLGSPVVTLTVKGQGGAALATVVQGAARPGEKLEDYAQGWADFLLKLKTLLETERWEREVLARALVRATPAEVYRLWLNPQALAQLLPGKATVKAKAGGRFSWQHRLARQAHTGTFLELHRNKRISFTWEAPEGSGRPASEAALEAQPTPYGTLVSVHHTGLLGLSREQLFSQRMFWLRLLERLRAYCWFQGKIKSAD